MNVKTLIELLSHENPDQEVYFSFDSHDRWGTTLAAKVTEIGETEIQYTAYHECFCVPKSDESNDSENDDKQKTVILLS
jgi:hypothetical protein